MILSDTDILSAFAKIGRLSLLYELFQVEQLHIVPAVLQELEAARSSRRAFAGVIFGKIATHNIIPIALTQSESELTATLPITLDDGERESMAVAYQRDAILLCNESRVAYWNRHFGIEYFNLPMLLRAFWTQALLTQDEVQQIIYDLQTADRMGFSAKTLTDIFLKK